MALKENVLGTVRMGRDLIGEVAGRIPAEESSKSGSFETWASKDGLAHVAEWLDVDVKRLGSDGVIEAIPEESIEERNKAIFDKHASKSWDEVMRFVDKTFRAATDLVSRMTDADLEREREFSDGSKRPPWRMIAGHALMHTVPHLGLICSRTGLSELPTKMEEDAARVLLELPADAEFHATVKYNLACRYALDGRAEDAVSLLRESLPVSDRLCAWAPKDEDLVSLRERADFKALVD